MATKNVRDSIMEYLMEYNDEVEDGLKEVYQGLEKETLSKLKDATRQFNNPSKQIYKHWKVEDDGHKIIFYNTMPHTHLLNNGHALRNGGRARAYHFMEPIEDWLAEEAPKRVAKVLGG